MEIAGEDGLGDLLREADIEAVDAAATGEVHRPEQLAAGINFDTRCLHPASRNFSTNPRDSKICRERG